MSKFPDNLRGPVVALGLLCAAVFGPAQAQRHPESGGALPYYRDEPGVSREPDWKRRPAFIRGPRDRFERGRNYLFLGADDGVAYTNYANQKYLLPFRELVPWSSVSGRPFEDRRVRWDRLGNYMGSSYLRVFSLEEGRSSTGDGISMVDHRGLQLRIGHYAYKNLHWTATVGASNGQIRTRFTPLTLVNSRMEAVRLDLDYKNARDRGTVIYSRGGKTASAVLFSNWGDGSGDNVQKSPVLLYAGHWQHSVGDFASFGTSFVNQLMNHTSSVRSNTIRGDLPYQMQGAKTITVVVGDDSPRETQHNARVYSMNVVVEGTRDGEPIRLTSVAGQEGFDARLRPVVDGGRVLADDGREAVGKETVNYTFTVPTDVTVKSARFVADVADDYRIGVRQTHDFLGASSAGTLTPTEMTWPAPFNEGESITRRPFKWYNESDEVPYFTVVRSDGTGPQGANRKVVSFDYGMPTGQSLASINWQADLVGLELSGEVAHNLQNYMYPLGADDGQRSTKGALAYWVKGDKDLFAGLKVGVEVYRMDPNYSGGYDSYRGGMPFHMDLQDSPGQKPKGLTQEFGLVEDNDDGDSWPDESGAEVATNTVDLYPGEPTAYTYPGLDDNVDSIVDSDRNENFVPDWEEAFATYETDPPQFVYGVDFNNNEFPDFRENDDLPDYPYKRDSKGRHYLISYTRLGKLGKALTLGRYTNNEVAGSGKVTSLYLRYRHEYRKSGVGEFQINYDLKKVKDSIADHSYVFIIPPDDLDIIPWLNKADGPPEQAGLYRPATPDALSMRNSLVHTFYVNTKYSWRQHTNLSNGLVWFRNGQAEVDLDDASGLLQPKDVRSRITLINKIDHTWGRGNWTLQPKFKHRLIREVVDSEDEPRKSYSEFIPLLVAHYRLTNNTSFEFGAQGFVPFIPYRWDRVPIATSLSQSNVYRSVSEGYYVGPDAPNTFGTFKQSDYLAMLRIRAEYFGIRDNSFYLGYQRTNREYDSFEDRNFTQNVIFVELISPF